MVMAHKGDIKLAMYSDMVAWELFGKNNREITQLVLADWKSNRSWTELALFYKFDQYITWLPKSVQKSVYERTFGDIKKIDKFWADLWEAWWAIVFLEREKWDDDIDDLKSIIRRLIFLKYRPLAEHYSTVLIMDRSTRTNIPSVITEDQISMIPIDVNNERIKICIKSKTKYDKDVVPFGYLATLSLPINPDPDSNVSSQKNSYTISLFSSTQEMAKSKAFDYATKGWIGTNHFCRSFG